MASCLSSPSPPYLDPISLLHNCTNSKHLAQIHARVLKSPNFSHTQNHIINTNLLRLYSSYGNLNYATSIFNQMQSPPTFAWNLIIRAHTINGLSLQSVILYNLMICSGITPDKFTFPFVFKACAGFSGVEKGMEIHGFAIKTGFYKRDSFVKNTVMDMYLKCGELGFACKVFDEMSVRNVVSWTTMVSGFVAAGEVDCARGLFDRMPERNVVSWSVMINGYVMNGRPQEAVDLFTEMQEEGVMPNEFTLVSLLKACIELGSLRLGSWVHDFALKNGFGLGVYLGTALVDMYSKCGSLEEAQKVFNLMEERSLATWNSMISSLCVHGRGDEALSVFEEMMKQNVMPDAITFVGVLGACARTNRVHEGLRYFSYMTDKCGIVPIVEHYVYMFDLWSRAKALADLRYYEGDWTGGKTKVLISKGTRSDKSKAPLVGDIRAVDTLGDTVYARL